MKNGVRYAALGELPHFDNTIKWINSSYYFAPDALPLALLAVFPSQLRNDQPVIDIFINDRTPETGLIKI